MHGLPRLLRGVRSRLIRLLGVRSDNVVYARDLAEGQLTGVERLLRYSEAHVEQFRLPPDERLEFRAFPERWTFRMSNVSVDLLSGTATTPDGQLIADSTAWPPLHQMATAPALNTRDRNTFDSSVIVYPGSGYYHWLIEDLPAFLRSFELMPSATVVCGPNMPTYAREALSLFSGARIVSAKGTSLRATSYVFTSKTSDSGWPDRVDIMALRRFAEGQGLLASQPPSEAIYLSRVGLRRTPLNEVQLEKRAVKHGFRVISPHRLSWVEQVRLLSRAKAVVGVHGAGLSNQVWMPTRGSILEIFPPAYLVTCFAALAQYLGHDYYYVLSAHRSDDWVVDEDKFEELLGRMR